MGHTPATQHATTWARRHHRPLARGVWPSVVTLHAAVATSSAAPARQGPPRERVVAIKSAAVGTAIGVLFMAAIIATGPDGDATSPPVVAAPPATPLTLVSAGDAVTGLLDRPDRSVVATASPPNLSVYGEPDGETLHRLTNPTENGGPLVLLVVEAREGWLRVDLPIRPNGSQGWVRQADVVLTTNPYRIVVNVTERMFRLFRLGTVVKERPVAVGATDTPTPGGRFYIKELLQPPDPHTVYGPYAFILSGYSNVLEDFNGGQGVIGIHGTDDPAAIGNEVSHGCIRLANEDVDELVGVLPLGTPVEIEA